MAKRFDKDQIDALRSAFKESENLTKDKKMDLASSTGLDVEQISSWFNRKRASKRARESVGDLRKINDEMRSSLEEQSELIEKLDSEIQERKSRQQELEDENRLLKRRLAIFEGDSQFDALMSFYKSCPYLSKFEVDDDINMVIDN